MKKIKGITSTNRNDTVKWYLFLLGMAFIIAIANRFFINLSGTFAPGLSGIAQGLVYTTWNIFQQDGRLLGMDYSGFVNTFYSAVYWLLNIPLIVFSFRMIGRRFTWSSLFILFTSLMFTILLAQPWLAGEIFSGEGIQHLISYASDSSNEFSDFALMLEYIILIVLGFIGGTLYGVATGLIYNTGTSTMGIDPVTKHLEQTRGMNLNMLMFIFSITNMIIWIVIIALTGGHINSFQDLIGEVFFAPTMFSSLLFMIGFLLTSNLIYASNKKVMVEIYSKDTESIAKELVNKKLINPNWIRGTDQVFNKEKVHTISVIANTREVSEVIECVKDHDEHSIITVVNIHNGNDWVYRWTPDDSIQDIEHEQELDQ